jgi:hypothetical protein
MTKSTNPSISKLPPSQPCTTALEPLRACLKIMKFEKRYQLNVELSGNLAATFNWIMDHPQVQSYPYGDILDGSSDHLRLIPLRYEPMASP